MKRRTQYCSPAPILLLLLLPVFAHSQAPGDGPGLNRPGIHSVSGTVYTPDRTTAGRGLLVRLSRIGNDFTAWTDPDGKYFITGIANGTYTLSVEAGEEFEPVSQRFEVALTTRSPAQTFFVDLQLQRKPGAIQKPNVLDAEIAAAPKNAQEHYRNARAAASKNDTQAAVDALLLAVSEYPGFAIAHTELGVQYQKLNQLERSDEHLQLALKLKPGAYDPLASRGILLVRMKKYAEADSVLRDVLKIKDDSAVVRLYLGRSLVGQRKPDAAETEFRTALNMGGSEMIEARRALANIYLERGESEKALAELEAYLAANPTPADEKKLRDTVQQIKDLLKENRKP